MMRATEQLLTIGRRWLQLNDRLCQLPTQAAAFARFEQLTIDPVQQLSQQLSGVLPSGQGVGPVDERLPDGRLPDERLAEVPNQSIAAVPPGKQSWSMPPTRSHNSPGRSRPPQLAQKAASLPLSPAARQRLDPHPTPRHPVPSSLTSPASEAVFSLQPNNGSPDPQLFAKTGDLNPADFSAVELPSVKQMSRVMAALSLPPAIDVPHPAPHSAIPQPPARRVSAPDQGYASIRQVPSARSFQAGRNQPGRNQPIRNQPSQPRTSLTEPHLQLAQSASALARVLEANVSVGKGAGNREQGMGNGDRAETAAVEAPGAPLTAAQTLLVEEILDELSDRLELDFIRTYGTSGGS
jgi:hypothetical protein